MDRNDFASRVVEQTDRMYRIAYVMLHNDEDCRDAMQEAALKAWEKRFTLREPKYFATWLTRILINECRNIQRKRKTFVPIDEAIIPAAPAHDPTLSIANIIGRSTILTTALLCNTMIPRCGHASLQRTRPKGFKGDSREHF